MRRVLGAMVLGLILAPAAAQAGNHPRIAYNYHSYGANDVIGNGVVGNRGFGAPAGGTSAGYSTYGRRLRGGFGRNGFAPTMGPLWGPNAFMPAGGQAPPLGAYHAPYEPEAIVAPDAVLQQQQAVDVVDPLPAAPKVPPLAAPALK